MTGAGPYADVGDAQVREGLPAPLGRWLRPGPPRRVAAVLLLVALVFSFVGTGFGVAQTGVWSQGASMLALFVLPAFANAAGGLALAAFVLTGSLASRVLGSLVALGSLLVLVGPALFGGLPLSPLLVVYGAVAAVHVGTVVALAVPARPSWSPGPDGAADAPR